ncbi:MAG: ATP-binding cassette domain-containing protein [Desulfovibrio sp.]|jgi:lipopolysaccharide transport system ATP-binding protein|nr:ATP-binding cassette domain-containing protein [Desulfovibrio sp.]
MKPVISVENLGKRYRIRHAAADAPTNFREALAALPRKLLGGGARAGDEEFWALRDVSFDIMPGERVGIIGRNGAGKSTLLKLLSRITEPTTGKITLRGRAASLLEVGTGFHPELTGRENIYLNGAILGMSRAEVQKKFDEIVDFAGVEKFLDTPVKRYSSGMSVRLGFAVAAHLEPEILIVDEVLAVGDREFQKKCLGKMEEVSEGEGRTVLFVSHQLAMIEALCDKTLLLENSLLALDAVTSEAITRYLGINTFGCAIDFSRDKPEKNAKARLLKASLARADGTPTWNFELNDPIHIRMEYEIFEDTGGPAVPNLHFTDAGGQYLCVNNMPEILHGKPGRYAVSCVVPGHLFNAGQVCVGLALTSYVGTSLQVHFFARSILVINIKEDLFAASERYGYGGPMPGAFRPQFAWSGGLLHG